MENRQDNLEQLISAFSVMQKEQEYIKEDVRKIKGDMKTLAKKLARYWESIVERVITVVVGAVVRYFLSGGMFS